MSSAAQQSEALPGCSFRVLSFNVNDKCMSESAPDSWTWEQQQEAFRSGVLALRPDVLALQECMGIEEW
jgi:hypothetical protein